MIMDRENFKRGDLLFLRCDGSDFSRAIVDVSSPELQLDHVGICDGAGYVIEANVNRGVVATTLADFLARAPHWPSRVGWLRLAIPVDADVDVDAAVARARSFIGLKYNHRFMPATDALYCSELVQRSFLLSDGEYYFPFIRMDFGASDGTLHPFWVKYFAGLKMPVPQGKPGTSPLSIYTRISPF